MPIMPNKNNVEQIVQNISQIYYPMSAVCQKEFTERAVLKMYYKPTVIVKEGQFV
jgi:hypothetical protein